TIYTTSRSTANGAAGVNVLFGSILGLSAGRARLAAITAAAIGAVTLAIARPLLFASIDEAVAAARGVPVRLLGIGFLALVGASAAEATQAVGALLLRLPPSFAILAAATAVYVASLVATGGPRPAAGAAPQPSSW